MKVFWMGAIFVFGIRPVGPDYGRGVPAPHAFGVRPAYGLAWGEDPVSQVRNEVSSCQKKDQEPFVYPVTWREKYGKVTVLRSPWPNNCGQPIGVFLEDEFGNSMRLVSGDFVRGLPWENPNWMELPPYYIQKDALRRADNATFRFDPVIPGVSSPGLSKLLEFVQSVDDGILQSGDFPWPVAAAPGVSRFFHSPEETLRFIEEVVEKSIPLLIPLSYDSGDSRGYAEPQAFLSAARLDLKQYHRQYERYLEDPGSLDPEGLNELNRVTYSKLRLALALIGNLQPQLEQEQRKPKSGFPPEP